MQHENAVLGDQLPQSTHGSESRLRMKIDQQVAAEDRVVWRSILKKVVQKIGRNEIPSPESHLRYHGPTQTPAILTVGLIEIGRAVPRVVIAERSLAEDPGLRGL